MIEFFGVKYASSKAEIRAMLCREGGWLSMHMLGIETTLMKVVVDRFLIGKTWRPVTKLPR